MAELAVFFRFDDLQKLFIERQEPNPESLHDEETFFFCYFIELLRVVGVGRKRLLAEDVFTCVQAKKRIFKMKIARRRDVDGLDFGIRGQFLVGAVGLGNVMFIGKFLRFLPVAWSDRRTFLFGRLSLFDE